MHILEVVYALLFVGSSGLLFNERFRKNWILVGIAATIAIVSTTLLTMQIVDSMITSRMASTGEPAANVEEQIAWRLARSQNTLDAYSGYLEEFPEGAHASEARDRVVALSPAAPVAPTPAVDSNPDAILPITPQTKLPAVATNTPKPVAPAEDNTDPTTGASIFGHTGRGAAIAAITGAIGGAFAGGNDGRNAAVGAAVGALAGQGIGRYLDGQEEDLRRQTIRSGVLVQRLGDTIQLIIPTDASFDTGSANLAPTYLPVLDKVALSLSQYPKTIIDIVGHTSSEGSEQANLSLSLKRADALRDHFQQKGVLAQRLATGGAGELYPLVFPDDTEAKRSVNRRIEIVLRPVTN